MDLCQVFRRIFKVLSNPDCMRLLAVVAHVRHVETRYDRLLMSGWERAEARLSVEDTVQSVLAK